MPRVQMPDGKVIQFPDSMSRDEIAVAAKKYTDGLKPSGQQRQGDEFGMFVTDDAIRNIPSSAANLAENLGSAIAHPIETAKGVYRLGSGVMQKAIPGEQGNEPYADAAWQALKDRYGGYDEIRRTIATDPVGAAADVATLGFAGGGALRGLGAAAKSGKLAAAGRAMTAGASALDPVNVAARAVVRPVGAVGGGRLAGRMIEGVLKPSKRKSMFATPESRRALVETMARESVSPNANGVETLQGRIDPLSDKVNAIIDAGTAEGGPANAVSRKAVLERLDPVMERASRQAAPTGDLRQASSVAADFIENHPETMTPRQAQDVKVATGRALHKSYGEMKNAKIEATKAIQRGIKEELEGLYPELKTLNAKQKELIDLKRAIEDAIPRIENRNVFSLSDWAIASGLGAGAAVEPMSTMVTVPALATKVILGHPTVKSRLAIALIKARDFKSVPGAGIRSAIYQADKANGLGGR